MNRRVKNGLLCWDQLLLSVLTLGESNPWQTCSAAAYNMERQGRFFGFWRPVIDAVMWRDPQHCKTSYENELLRARALVEERA